MSDELRDDIAAVIVAMGKDDPVEVAQAVIDDLGLTVEEGYITGQGHGLPGVIGNRIVGRWESVE